jgi:hypothetical protein
MTELNDNSKSAFARALDGVADVILENGGIAGVMSGVAPAVGDLIQKVGSSLNIPAELDDRFVDDPTGGAGGPLEIRASADADDALDAQLDVESDTDAAEISIDEAQDDGSCAVDAGDSATI